MVAGIRRPILITGLGLTASVWLLENLNHSLGSWGTFCVLGIGVAGVGNWWLRQKSLQGLDFQPGFVDRTTVESALTNVKTVFSQLEQEAKETDGCSQQMQPALDTLQAQIAQVTTEMERDRIRLGVVGGKSVGKTSLFQHLQTEWAVTAGHKLNLRDTPGLFDGSSMSAEAEEAVWQSILECDLVLLLTSGDLTDPEFQTLERLAKAQKRILLVFNKQDQYLPSEQQLVLKRLQERAKGMLSPEDVVAIAAQPSPIKVRQHQADGSVQERLDQPAAAIATLTDRLSQILLQEGQQLVLASCLSAVQQIKTEARSVLNDIRRTKALPMIEKYQWISAATAFASPLPALDVLATAAINAQMVLDLSNLYQQKFSLQQAQTIAGTMASLLLKLGLVELSVQTVTGLLKSNAVTFAAGGAVQGVSAAYLTRLAGLSLVEYFQEQEVGSDAANFDPLKLKRLGETLQHLFQQNQRVAFLKTFVQQAVGYLTQNPQSLPASELQSVSAQPVVVLSENEKTVLST